jgi:hypothetical protein
MLYDFTIMLECTLTYYKKKIYCKTVAMVHWYEPSTSVFMSFLDCIKRPSPVTDLHLGLLRVLRDVCITMTYFSERMLFIKCHVPVSGIRRSKLSP